MMRVAELEKQLLQREKELESIKVPGKGRAVGASADPASMLWAPLFLPSHVTGRC